MFNNIFEFNIDRNWFQSKTKKVSYKSLTHRESIIRDI